MLQLEMFQEQATIIELQSEIKKLREQTENVRKGVFARYQTLEKQVKFLMERFDER